LETINFMRQQRNEVKSKANREWTLMNANEKRITPSPLTLFACIRVHKVNCACARESTLGYSRFDVDLFGSGYAGLGMKLSNLNFLSISTAVL